MGHSIFITGTDTGVGKTFFSRGIIRTLRELGVDAVGFKPIECGGRADSKELLAASGESLTLDEVNPISLDQPLAPLAAVDSPEELPIDKVKQAHEKLVNNHELVIVEGAGGWLVPITADYSMGDLASEMCDEVIIVAANKLGVINHTLLTYRAIQEKKIDCARLVLNHPPVPESETSGYSPQLYPAESFPVGAAADLSLASNAKTIQTCLPSLELFSLFDETNFAKLAESMFTA
ncbi:MAG: dethiobiotin synthase [Verrucomicrobiales bacterium]|nr:dethiobiotin synthase [Verrucomicrobiales bacterium]